MDKLFNMKLLFILSSICDSVVRVMKNRVDEQELSEWSCKNFVPKDQQHLSSFEGDKHLLSGELRIRHKHGYLSSAEKSALSSLLPIALAFLILACYLFFSVDAWGPGHRTVFWVSVASGVLNVTVVAGMYFFNQVAHLPYGLEHFLDAPVLGSASVKEWCFGLRNAALIHSFLAFFKAIANIYKEGGGKFWTSAAVACYLVWYVAAFGRSNSFPVRTILSTGSGVVPSFPTDLLYAFLYLPFAVFFFTAVRTAERIVYSGELPSRSGGGVRFCGPFLLYLGM